MSTLIQAQMLTMLDEIDRIAQKNGTGTDTGIAIVSPDYWPRPGTSAITRKLVITGTSYPLMNQS